MNENSKEKYQLKKIDFLLPSIPIIMLLYPTILLGNFFFNWFSFDESGEIWTILSCILIFCLSSILWAIKLFQPFKKVVKFKPLGFGLVIGCLNIVLFGIFALSIFSIVYVEETAQTLWVLILGFFYIVFLKVIADFHYVPKVYDEIKRRFYSFLETE